MDLTFKEKIIKFIGHNLNINTKKQTNQFFHIDCKFTKKRFCTCRIHSPTSEDLTFSNLISILSSKDCKFDLKENKINYNPKVDYECNKKKTLEEMIDHTPIDSLKKVVNEYESISLTKKEYKEIFQAIEKGKKCCEFCKIMLIDNGFQKGWKNPDTGENVLLCHSCNKKYQQGNLEKNTDLYIGGYNNNSSESYKESRDKSTVLGYSSIADISNSSSFNKNVINLSNTYNTVFKSEVRDEKRKEVNVSNNTNIFKIKPPNPVPQNHHENGNYIRPNFQVKSQKKEDSNEITVNIDQTNLLSQKRERSDCYICKSDARVDCLKCNKCSKVYHCSCLNLSFKYVSRFNWSCQECKNCEVCFNKNTDLKCGCCDRAFHSFCKNWQNREALDFYCNDCLICSGCRKTCSVPNLKNLMEVAFYKSKRVCLNCLSTLKSKKIESIKTEISNGIGL